jgi:hypothetical protein
MRGFLARRAEGAVFIDAAREQVLQQARAHALLLGDQRLRRLDLSLKG